MDRAEMDRLIEEHIQAEMEGDSAGAVAMYTDDVVHDVVGSPMGPLHGPAAAQGFYDHLIANVRNDRMQVTHSLYGEDFCVVEHQCDAAVTGEFLGVPGEGREISFRMMHVWEFRDGRISREVVWLDGGSIMAQLTGPGAAPVPG
ncbi:MAG: nuclear transport factor 2 family protein [Actinomycetota bacterium]|nr:nuclear transport factor 2 family protein [Actinomycetota bacterium]